MTGLPVLDKKNLAGYVLHDLPAPLFRLMHGGCHAGQVRPFGIVVNGAGFELQNT
jgi:hypothetical protein